MYTATFLLFWSDDNIEEVFGQKLTALFYWALRPLVSLTLSSLKVEGVVQYLDDVSQTWTLLPTMTRWITEGFTFNVLIIHSTPALTRLSKSIQNTVRLYLTFVCIFIAHVVYSINVIAYNIPLTDVILHTMAYPVSRLLQYVLSNYTVDEVMICTSLATIL